MTDLLLIDGRRLEVELLEPLVRTYLVRPRGPHTLALGQRCQLVVGDNPPVRCTVDQVGGDTVRLYRGWGI